MELEKMPGLHWYLTEWSEDIEILRQNSLLSAGFFLTFARDRGVHAAGFMVDEPNTFHEKGWLPADRVDDDGGLWFHPFRFYALREISGALERNRRLTMFSPQRADDVDHDTPRVPTIEIPEVAAAANDVVGLALLLEPLYWPGITGNGWRINTHSRERHPAELFRAYREKVLPLVRNLDVRAWQKIHESLRIEAARVDDTPALYLLLRLSVWREREELKGAISGALWIRHIAEVIRRGFEDAYGVRWDEEDCFCSWLGGAREREYGAERPLDEPLRCKPYIAFNFGLFTGSAVRWYVEGATEYYAIEELLGQPSKIGVELINLKGNIAAERDNAAMKLEEWLKEDKKFRRFSVISFDIGDVPPNVKFVRRQVQQDNIVGAIAVHDPDFEFANFTLGELVDIAAGLAEDSHSSGTTIKDASWTGITSAKEFERRYSHLVGGSLKGKAWGCALAVYARKNPRRSDNGKERRIMQDVAAAFRGRIASYDAQKEQSTFDPETFETIARPSVAK